MTTARMQTAGAAETPADSRDARAREMAELCITFNGRHYGYRGYRYERLADAVNYARLDRSRPFSNDAGPDDAPPELPPAPSQNERALMGMLGITCAEGGFRWRQYRYERLADAIAYARLALTR